VHNYRFEQAVLDNAPQVRGRLLSILQAALDAVRPDQAVAAQLRRAGNLLTVGGATVDLATCERVLVLGAGKAGAPMVQVVEAALGDRLMGGLVVVKTGHGAPTRWIDVVEAGHPVPTQAGLDAGARVLQLAQEAGPRDLVLVLLSGGGSALLETTAGISLADLQQMTAALLACGATITEMNCLRKHMSLLKGGQLARAVYPAQLITLVLSDVVGSPLDVIASGPTVPDSTTWVDAWGVVEKYNLAAQLPAGVLRRLQAGLAGELPDTPGPGDVSFARSQIAIVGDNRVAAQAAAQRARELGYNTLLLSTFIEGEAQTVAQVAAALAKEVLSSGQPAAPPACLILGGETTVTLRDHGKGDRESGLGGRNQELGVAAALALQGIAGVTVAALATDGSDGPTDSAGAVIDGGTVARGAALGYSAAEALRCHNAYPFLAATGDLLRSGPTQTNVNDLIVIMVDVN
jgi:hydroxypyruvate reductase